MSKIDDVIHSNLVNTRVVQNRQFLFKVIDDEIKEDCSLKKYLKDGVKNNDFYVMMCIRNFVIKKQYK